MRATYDCAEPGVIFVDRVNSRTTWRHCETISASNPCGEQMLPPYGACLLGSINLARLVERPYEPGRGDRRAAAGRADPRRGADARQCHRHLALSAAATGGRKPRPSAGSASALPASPTRLLFCGAAYGSGHAVALTSAGSRRSSVKPIAHRLCSPPRKDRSRSTIRACSSGPNLAPRRGDPGADRRAWPEERLPDLDRPDRHDLPARRQRLVGDRARFRLFLPAPDPAGRRIGTEEPVEDYAMRLWRAVKGDAPPPPDLFVSAQTLSPSDHLTMQAAAQALIDSSISKTVNCPEDIAFEDFADIYVEGYHLGCKGLTTYRPNAVTGSVLRSRGRPSRAGGRARRARRGHARFDLQAQMARQRARRLHHHQRRGARPDGGRSRSSSTPRTWSIMPGRWAHPHDLGRVSAGGDVSSSPRS